MKRYCCSCCNAFPFSTPSAPAQVSGLRLSNLGSTDSLQARWAPASGYLDSYQVLLVHDSSVIKNESVMANISSLSFQALRPGALYRVVVTTVRVGHISRQTVSEGRTGKKRQQSFQEQHEGGVELQLKQSAHAVGDLPARCV